MSFNFQQGGGQQFGPEAYQQYQQGGNFDNMNHDDVYNHYQQFAGQASPQDVYNAHHEYYQQMPQQQRQGLLGGLMNAFQQHGVNPQQAGIQPNDPSPQNLARANQYAAQNPDVLQNVFGPGGALSSPLAKTALAGALAFGASKFFGNGGFNFNR